VSPARGPRSRTRAEAWLWTGPLGHLLGGLLDLSGALIRYALARARSAPADDRRRGPWGWDGGSL